MSEKTKSVFETLSAINVNDKAEKKSGLTYLSWAWAWGEVKKIYPDAIYHIVRCPVSQAVYSFDADLGYMVMTSVTIQEQTLQMWLPVMDGANKAMKNVSYDYTTRYGDKSVEQASMFDINKTLMRCLVKNLAMFGLGHYIFAGEDLPENESDDVANTTSKPFVKIPSLAQPSTAKKQLKKATPEWDKVTQWITANKGKDIDFILQTLSRGYVISPAVQKDINLILDTNG